MPSVSLAPRSAKTEHRHVCADSTARKSARRAMSWPASQVLGRADAALAALGSGLPRRRALYRRRGPICAPSARQMDVDRHDAYAVYRPRD